MSPESMRKILKSSLKKIPQKRRDLRLIKMIVRSKNVYIITRVLQHHTKKKTIRDAAMRVGNYLVVDVKVVGKCFVSKLDPSLRDLVYVCIGKNKHEYIHMFCIKCSQ